MGFMRLGTRVAVINEKNEILLSKRGDFGTWALPGGRVDSGELLHDTAIREVREETGLEVEIVRPVGLYFQQGRSRTDILYRAKPIGGELFKRSDETLDNRFFAPDSLPELPFGKFYIDHAYSDKTYLYTIETPAWELFKLDLQLRWRWIQNLIAGRPEPKFPKFLITAVAIIFNSSTKLVITLLDELPAHDASGKRPIHKELDNYPFFADLDWEWLGLWQDTEKDTIEFIFSTRQQIITTQWTKPKDIPSEHDRSFVEMALKNKKGVWALKK